MSSRHALPLLAMLALAAAPRADAATQPFTITSFDSVRVDAPVRVLVTTGGGITARAEGDRALIERLDLSVSGGLLVVRLKAPVSDDRTWGDKAGGDKAGGGVLTVRVSTQDVRRAWLTGGGTLNIDRMRGQRAILSLGGGGELSVGMLAVDRLSADLSGGGRMTLAGDAGDAVLSISGSGALAADGLTLRTAKLLNNGAGSLTARAIISADIVASGSGDVIALGKPACTVRHTGSGRVTCAGEER